MNVSLDTIRKIIERLPVSDRHCQSIACMRLAMIGAPALPALMQASRDPRIHIRKGAICALSAMESEQAKDVLEKMLTDLDAEVRLAAASALAPSQLPRALDELVNQLNIGAWIRMEKLACYRNQKAISSLKSVLSGTNSLDDYDAIKAACHLILMSKEMPVGATIADLMSQLFQKVERLAARFEPEMIVDDTDNTFELDEELDEFLGIISSMLAEVGEEVIPYCVDALSNPSASVKLTALRTLEEIGSPDAGTQLLPLIRDSCTGIRKEASQLAGKWKFEAAIPELEWLASCPGCYWDACFSLGLIGTEAAARALVKLERMTDEADPYADLTTVYDNLGSCGDAGLSELKLKLASSNPEVRWRAAQALNKSRNPDGLAFLAGAVMDTDDRVRLEAEWAQIWVRGERPGDIKIALKFDPTPYYIPSRILSSTDVESLLLLFRTGNAEVRATACKALSTIDEPVVISELIACLRDDEAYKTDLNAGWGTRCGAANALGKLRAAQAVEVLLETLDQNVWEWIHGSCILALAEIGDPRGVERIREIAIYGPDNLFRYASDALKRLGGLG